MKSRKKPEQAPVALPSLDGFTDVTSRKGDGWYQPGEGSWVIGKLMGRFTLGSGKRERAYYQIGVNQASPVAIKISGKGKEAQETPVEKGQVINVDDRKALEDLRAYAETDGEYYVYIQWGALQKLESGNTFWPAEVKIKTIKPPTHRVKREAFNSPPEMSSNPYSAEDYADDDIPF